MQKYCKGNGLDLGCANRKKHPFAIGVDVNREGGKTPELVWDVETDLPFRSGTLDYILACHVVEHLDDPVKSILMWLKKIKKGGYLVLVVPDRRFVPNIGSLGADPTHLHDWSPESFKEEVISKVLNSLNRQWLDVVEHRELNNNWSFITVLRRRE